MQLLTNLRDIRSMVTGDMLDSGCNAVRYKIGQAISCKLDPVGNSKLRNIIKSLLLLGANLSQSREFRDLFEDVLTKVVLSLQMLTGRIISTVLFVSFFFVYLPSHLNIFVAIIIKYVHYYIIAFNASK